MGCRPASAAPTVRPAKPDSVMGESITLFSPKRSRRPLVTLYLLPCQHAFYASFCQHSVTTPSSGRSSSCLSHSLIYQSTMYESNVRSIVLRNLLTQHKHLVVRLHLLGHGLIERLSHRHLLLSRGIASPCDNGGCDSWSAESWAESEARGRSEEP
jgi:hypothetical protein